MNKAINEFGFWSGMIAFASAASYVIGQLLQVFGILSFPLDEILIYGTSLCIAIPFVLEILAVHYITSDEKKFWSHSQTPHSLFWDFDALGYIFMGLAMLMAIPAFEKQGFQRLVRISLLSNAAVTPLIAFVYFYPTYSEKLLFLGFPWGITAPLAMLMLAIMFKKNNRVGYQ